MNTIDIEALINNTATIETRIDVLKADGSVDFSLTQEDSVQSWEYTDARYVPEKGFIGMFVERNLDGVLKNITEDFNIDNREIKLYFGIRRYVDDKNEVIDTNGTEYEIIRGTDKRQGDYITVFYSLGNFIVIKPEDDDVKDNTQFNARDYTLKFNIPFDGDFKDSEFTKSLNEHLASDGSVTALWLAKYTCKQAGVVLGSETFANSNFAIPSNQFQNGDQCRDVMKYIGKLAFTWVRIGWDNKVWLDFDVVYDNNAETIITADNYYSLTVQNEKFGPVNKVVVGSSIVEGDYSFVEDEFDIENGEKVLVVNDNPILYTPELREQAVLEGERLFELEYTPLTIETTGHPWLQGNELIGVKDANGNMLYTYPFDRTISYNGHIRTTLSSIAETAVEQDYSYKGTGSSENQKKQTRLILDRAEQTITALVENVEEQNSQISELNVSLSGIRTTVNNNYTELAKNMDNYATTEDVTTIRNAVDVLQTATSETITVVEEIQTNGVTQVRTENNYTFNKDGLIIEETGAKTKGVFDNKGVDIINTQGDNSDLLYAGYVDEEKADSNTKLKPFEGQTIVYSNNMYVDNYLLIGSHSRMEDYIHTWDDGREEDATGIFWLGG